jgi:hypothetical protein
MVLRQRWVVSYAQEAALGVLGRIIVICVNDPDMTPWFGDEDRSDHQSAPVCARCAVEGIECLLMFICM